MAHISLTPTIIVGCALLAALLGPVEAGIVAAATNGHLPGDRRLLLPDSPADVTSSHPQPPDVRFAQKGFDNYSKLRKALFGSVFRKSTQSRIVLNLLLHYLIMTIALLICMFGIRILYYLPLFLFFFSTYYTGLFLNRFGDFRNLSEPILNLAWTIISFLIALALFIPLRRKEQTLALNLGICLAVVIICIIGLYVFHLESRRAAVGSLLASVLMGTAFTVLGLHNLDSLLIFGSSLIGSLIFVTNLQIALEDQSLLSPDDQGLLYFVESPVMYFLSVAIMFAVGLFTQKFQEKQQLLEMENSIAEIRNNITLD
jgi:hypothetical protein